MRLRVAILAVCMLLTGSLNTIATKLQDNVIVRYDEMGRPLRFKHPAFQTAAMFMGEALCLVPFMLRRWYKAAKRAQAMSPEEAAARGHQLRRSFWVFSLPAMCDAAASTLLNLGLFYTYASVFQMLRGTLVIFAGLLTIVLLHRRLHAHHWLGMVLICAGAALVGASSVIYDRAPEPKQQQQLAAAASAAMYGRAPGPQQQLAAAAADAGTAAAAAAGPGGAALGGIAGRGSGGGSDAGAGGGRVPSQLRRLLMLEGLGGADSGAAPDPLLGNILVVVAQLLAASQFIVEEKFLVKYRAPVLMAVGMEGFWGLVLSGVALPLLQHVRGPDGQPLDSISAALAEVRGNFTLQWTTATTVVSIAFFNFFGVSVTKNLSGAARATIDACRTLFIWLFALRMGWESFHMLQVVGFVILLSGTSVYNEILRSWLPASEPRPRSRRHHHGAAAAAADAEAGLQQPLLLGEEGFGGGGAGGAQDMQAGAGAKGPVGPGASPVHSAPEPAPASRPIAAGRPHDAPHARYTMARSVTILPAALSPHSLASVPSVTFGGTSFTFSVPRNVSTGSGLGSMGMLGSTPTGEGEDEEDEEGATAGYSESERGMSESDAEGGGGRERGADSRDSSRHGGSAWRPGPGPGPGLGGRQQHGQR